jgi:hypothetical protein
MKYSKLEIENADRLVFGTAPYPVTTACLNGIKGRKYGWILSNRNCSPFPLKKIPLWKRSFPPSTRIKYYWRNMDYKLTQCPG